MLPEVVIDLRQSPEKRWVLSSDQAEQARELLRSYTTDLGLSSGMANLVFDAAEAVVRPDYWAEMQSLAQHVGVPVRDVVVSNLYYDALKVALGCTAFAVNHEGAVLHARNLDWWTENGALSRTTTVCKFIGAPAGDFVTIGWPGFAGLFSGVAPGRFAISLNAVLSLEPAQLATPVVFLLRSVLEEAQNFDQAADMLATTPIPCDCLLLLSGIRSREMIVLERTPSRHAIRKPDAGFIAVTNDYRSLQAGGGEGNELLRTSCGRFQRITSLLEARDPQSPNECFTYLSDPEVAMRITVQQMVFRAANGEYQVRVPTR